MQRETASFIAQRWAVPADSFDLQLKRLHGGLESVVARATVRAAGRKSPVPRMFVIKEVRGASRREAAVYEMLARHLDQPPTARFFGRHAVGEADLLFLEHVEAHRPWPWSDETATVLVCRELARVHDAPGLMSWNVEDDYEQRLQASALETLDTALWSRDETGIRHWQRVGDLRRVVRGLGILRRVLLEADTTLIHGDVHPGNVIVRGPGTAPEVALIDWARARRGSPLEDVASWLHSVGCWEPRARVRHDTLLRGYLAARRIPRELTPGLRRAYWFASASNALSGAIRYHLCVLTDSKSTLRARAHSRGALREFERVIRRAAALMGPCVPDGAVPASRGLLS